MLTQSDNFKDFHEAVNFLKFKKSSSKIAQNILNFHFQTTQNLNPQRRPLCNKILLFSLKNEIKFSNHFCDFKGISRMCNIESNNSQNGGLEDYNNISDGIFPHFTTYENMIRVEGI